MKLVSYLNEEHDQLAFLVDGFLYDCDLLHPALPNSMNMFLQYWDDMFPIAQQVNEAIKDGRLSREKGIPVDGVQLLAPIPFPTSCREGVFPLSDSNAYPAFYFINHLSIQGPGNIKCMPDHLNQLDFGLEVAIVICRHARNIKASDADNYIGGIMIMNGMNARALQREEIKMNLSPSKSRDFSTVIGPCFITLDELASIEVPCKEGHIGTSWNLPIKSTVNGKEVCNTNLLEMGWTFAELVQHCAYGATLQPGDIISSGTLSGGSFDQLNAAGCLHDPGYVDQWLKQGDTIEVEMVGIDKLSNTILKEESDFSILANRIA